MLSIFIASVLSFEMTESFGQRICNDMQSETMKLWVLHTVKSAIFHLKEQVSVESDEYSGTPIPSRNPEIIEKVEISDGGSSNNDKRKCK